MANLSMTELFKAGNLASVSRIDCPSELIRKFRKRMPPAGFCDVMGTIAVRSRRFEMRDLLVLKLSFARHHVQGSCLDRDMHGAQIATLFAEWDIT